MSNRNFNKQTTNARQGLAEGGTAKGKLEGPKRNLGPRKRSPGPRSGRPSKYATPMPIEVDLSNPRDKVRPNPRKKLKPMPQDPIDKMEPRKPKFGRPSRPLDNIRSKGDKMKESLIGSKETRDKLRKFKSDMRKKKYAPEFKKKSTLLPKSKNSDLIDKMKKMERPKPKKLSESPERIKRQADYMKKHGKNEPRRKTLSVKNTYKKEVEGLKK